MGKKIKNTPPTVIISDPIIDPKEFEPEKLLIDNIRTEPYLMPDEQWMTPIKKEVDRLFALYNIKAKPGYEEMVLRGAVNFRVMGALYGEYTILRLIWIKIREDSNQEELL